MKSLFKKIRWAALFTLPLLCFVCRLPVSAAERLQKISENPVIVIDPGHGGENLGTQGGKTEEKYMTMITAMAMYEELSRYDNVTVYLTRTEDVDISLKERAAFAQSVNADFLFSVHYNASENHTLFGTEIWIPLSAPFNNYGWQFGHEYLAPMKERGLFVRGIKTRVGEKGLDYYGILRETSALEIPAVILEHCHVDEERDAAFCDSEDALRQFGIDDATAVAKYLGLKSSVLNVDYSDYQLAEAGSTKPVPQTKQDNTPPDVCLIEPESVDYGTGQLSLKVTAADYDTPLLYYDYSIDGGVNYSPLHIWPGCDALTGDYDDVFILNLQIPDGVKPAVILRAYNLYNLSAESNCYQSPETFSDGQKTSSEEQIQDPLSESSSEEMSSEEIISHPEKSEPADASQPAAGSSVEAEHEISFITFLEICLAVVIVLFILLLISQIISYRRRKRNRRQRRNVSGTDRYQHR